MARAWELVLAPLAFAGLGFLVDRVLGTAPVIAIVLGAAAGVMMFVRAWYSYDAQMRALEENGPWRKG